MADSLAGHQVELEIGAPAAGGACVARLDDDPNGRVVFVRHALPGERVRAQITEDRGGAFCRADAVEVLRAAPGRVPRPCPHAGPGRCGGCDWQHAAADVQRELKAAVIREQFARLAKITLDGVFTGVEALPGGLLGWRTRIQFATDRAGRLGLRKHGSHELELLDHCPLGVEGVGNSPVLQASWPKFTGVEVVCDGAGEHTVLGHRPGPGRQARGRRPPDRVDVVSGPPRLRYRAGGREFTVAANGFWQVHPGAADAISAAVGEFLAPQAGETALDLYAGSGALTAALASAVGSTGRVIGLESDPQAVADAEQNLTGLPHAEVRRGRVSADSVDELDAELAPRLVLLDPPRAGAGKDVMVALHALAPRALCYVSCDPATLARDVAVLAGSGWRLARLRALDAFPMTHHVECVALLLPHDSATGT